MAFPVSADRDWLLGVFEDVEQASLIAFMTRPLTPGDVRARLARFGIDREPNLDVQHYRCIYWDEQTRLCTIYENRPAMCRRYPGKDGCEHGCDCRGEAVPSRDGTRAVGADGRDD